MPRNKCCRMIGCMPYSRHYGPTGMKQSCGEIVLTLDEFEALRLADFEGLYQEEAAGKMNISRQTFGRIIDSAHAKVADMLINGKALKIEGGEVSIGEMERVRCPRCKKEFDQDFDCKDEPKCPRCKHLEKLR